MSDYDFPELPSDDDLGITEEDRKAYEEEAADGPEMTDAELEALLGERPSPSPSDTGAPMAALGGAGAAAGAPSKEPPSADPKGKEEKAVEKAAKKATRAEKRAKKKAERAARKAKQHAEAAAAAGASATLKGSAESSTGPEPDRAGVTTPKMPGQRTKWRGPVTVLILLGMTWFSSADRYTPAPVPANADESLFSSARAMSTLIEIARAPHPTGSPEHARVRALLLDHLTDLGLEPEVQTGVASVQGNGRARLVTTRNIVARIPGTDPTGAFLITAHYDARDQSLGAADAGSGVVAILEALRAAQTDGDFRNDVIILITDAEELGLMGARVFADEHRWMEDVRVAVSLEMRGSSGPTIMFETKDQNGWIIRQLADSDPHAYAYSLSFEVYQRMPNDTDFTIFREAGVQGLNFAGIDGAPAYHQRYDDPAHLSEATLQHHGEHALASLRHFGNVDLSEVDAPNVVYTTVPVLGMIVYAPVVGFALSGLIVVLFALAFVVARRGDARASRVGVGVVLSVLTAGGTGALGTLLLRFIPRFHGEFGGLQGAAVHGEGWYLLAIVGAAAALVWSVSIVARRWMHLSELALGALVLPALAAVVIGFAVPLVALSIQWPVLAAVTATLGASLFGDRFGGRPAWVLALLCAGVVLVVLVPVLQILALAMTIRLALGLGIIAAIILQLCLPALDALRHPNDWWAPLGAVATTSAFVAIGLWSASPSTTRPLPSTLAYAYEHGSGNAHWVTEPTDHPEDRLASEWVEGKVGALEERVDLGPFGYMGARAAATQAPVLDASRPEIVTLRNDLNGRRRVVDLAVRSRVGAELLQFRYGEAGTTRLLSVAGVPVDNPASLDVLEHWGEPEHGYLLLELEAPEGEPIDLYVTEHLLRPGELLDPSLFERPPELAPNPNWLSDRVMLRTSVADFADPSFAIVPVDSVPAGLIELLRGDPGPSPEGEDPDLDADGAGAPIDSVGVGAANGDTVAIVDPIDAVADTARAVVDTVGAPAEPDTVRADTVGAGTQ